MLCGGNTVIMCGTCDMGRKNFFCRTHFFSYPTPLGGVTPEKNIPPGIKNFFLPPPPCRTLNTLLTIYKASVQLP